ncbi:hypothetical protein JXO59_09405 [candidate division KSB1 bacterium]|nr:hypothetical protein [candidate division KSB1 bacterium]
MGLGYVIGYIRKDWTPTFIPPPPNSWFIDHAGNRIELYQPPLRRLLQSRK